MKTALFFLFSIGLSLPPLHAQDAALLAAESARGIMTGNNGVRWNVTVSGTKNAKFVATSQQGKVFAEVIEPADATGRR